MTTIQEANPRFNNRTQRTVKFTNTTHILLIGLIITMSHSVDSSLGLDTSQFISNHVDLSGNTFLAEKLFKQELKTTSVIVLTSLLDILYAIYPLLSESAKQEIISKFPNIGDSMSSVEKTSSSFLPESNFTVLNYSILTKPIEYNKTYVSILEDKYKFTFKNITDSSLTEQVNKLNQEVSRATNENIKNFLTEKILKNSVILLLSAITFDLKWKDQFASEDAKLKNLTFQKTG